MKYKNTKTGAIIDSPFKILGKNWVEVEKDEKEGLQKTVEETTETTITQDGDNGVNNFIGNDGDIINGKADN